ncbi:Protein CAP22 [Tolypocladium paradoxum]|uniref:Protein CAP22 n=1 Tax=Tolypocladium paradoxum TaxID=94208 RepID=A0A2S4KZH1_9HYPO|nr:Protein CAP22 [Tolypocladium paradoxum]
MYSVKTLALAVAPLLLVVHASADIEIGDVPASCKTICGPIAQLSDDCDPDLQSGSDRDEDLLEAQCVCTNKSFDVAKIAALCADCMHQSAKQGRRDDDEDDDQEDLVGELPFNDRLRSADIDDLLATCGFSSTTYSAAATSEVQNIRVVATAPTDIKQLTTTLTSSSQPPVKTSGGASGSGSMTSGGSSSMPSGATTTTSSGNSSTPSGATTTTSSGSSPPSGLQTNTATASTPRNAAPGIQPLGGVSTAGALYVAGAIVAGGWMMLQ